MGDRAGQAPGTGNPHPLLRRLGHDKCDLDHGDALLRSCRSIVILSLGGSAMHDLDAVR